MKKRLQLAVSNVAAARDCCSYINLSFTASIPRRRRRLPKAITDWTTGNKLWYSTLDTTTSRYRTQWGYSKNYKISPPSIALSNDMSNNDNNLKSLSTSYVYHFRRPLSSSTKEVNKKEEHANDNSNDKCGDNDIEKSNEKNSVLSIMSPAPLPNPPEIEQMEQRQKQKSAKPLVERISIGWRAYMSTWDGFFDNHGQSNTAGEDRSSTDVSRITIDGEQIAEKQKEVRKNIKRNVRFLKKEGAEALDAAKEFTGIHNKKDLVAWSMEQLKLANECVAEFMAGYRRGRDEEIDKMMNEYFKDFEFEGGGDTHDGGDQQTRIQAGRRRRRRKSKW